MQTCWDWRRASGGIGQRGPARGRERVAEGMRAKTEARRVRDELAAEGRSEQPPLKSPLNAP